MTADHTVRTNRSAGAKSGKTSKSNNNPTNDNTASESSAAMEESVTLKVWLSTARAEGRTALLRGVQLRGVGTATMEAKFARKDRVNGKDMGTARNQKIIDIEIREAVKVAVKEEILFGSCTLKVFM